MPLLTRVRVVVDHTMPTPLQRSTKLKISHWYFSQCLYPINTSYAVKNNLSKHFSTYFFHSHLFNEMLIVNGKSRCCNDTFYWRPVYIAASKKYLRRTQITLLESDFHWLFSLKFSFKLVTSSKDYARKQKWLFFSEHDEILVGT